MTYFWVDFVWAARPVPELFERVREESVGSVTVREPL